QLQLHLRGAAAETRQLDADRLARQMAVRLAHAADRPAEVAEDFPVRHRAAVHGPAARRLVGREELVRLSDAAEPQGVLPEAPRTHARPGQVLRRVADVGELPVEDAA